RVPLTSTSGRKNSTPTRLRKNTTDSLLTPLETSRMPTPISEKSRAERARSRAPWTGFTLRPALLTSAPQQRVEFPEQLGAAEHQLPAVAAELAPQACRADAGE